MMLGPAVGPDMAQGGTTFIWCKSRTFVQNNTHDDYSYISV